METKNENLVIEYSKVMRKSYINYAMDVITDRALPDIRDGLKPVHRRILYGMYELGLNPERQYKKSARIVGDVLGKYHAHGDTSVYEAMVRLAQDFKMNAPLVDGHGNWGSIDGDSAAAMRYTEAKLSPLAMTMLNNLNYNTVSFKDNFDGSEKEPTILPALLPNLLINGCDGIAVGMKTDIPTHNLGELLDCIIAYIGKPNMKIETMLNYMSAPDYPTGGIIVNKDDMLNIYKTGQGKVTIRSKYHIEDSTGGKKNIVITEIPYPQSGKKSKLIENIAISMKNKTAPSNIIDLRDESDKNGLRIVFEVKKGTNIDNIMNYLFTKTPLQCNHSCTFLVLNNKQPMIVNLKEYIDYYLKFQEEIMINKHKYLLQNTLDRLEIVDGLIRANNCIDTIVEMLRGCKTEDMARKCLTTGDITGIIFKSKTHEKKAMKFDFTQAQAKAILQIKLVKLINLEINKYMTEKSELEADIAYYKKLLSDRNELLKYIKKYLKEFKKKFAVPRKTEVTNLVTNQYIEDKNEEEELNILVDKFGYIKSVDTVSINRSMTETLDSFKFNFKIIGEDSIRVFTNKGNMYTLKLKDIPKVKIKDKGVPIDTKCQMEKDEYILNVIPNADLLNNDILYIYKNGTCSRIAGAELQTRNKCISCAKVDNEVINVLTVNNTTLLSIIYNDNMSKDIKVEEIEVKKKKQKPVKLLNVKKEIVLNNILINEVAVDKVKNE